MTILGQGQTYEYLQRRYTRVSEGMLIEPSLRYVEETLQDLDLDPTSKGVSAPGLAKIDTSVNLADVGTKHFTASRLEELKRLLGMVDVVDGSVLHAAASVPSVFCRRCGSTEVFGHFWRDQQRHGSRFVKN